MRTPTLHPLPSHLTPPPSNNQPTEMNKILKQKRGFHPPIQVGYLDRCNGAHLFTCTYFSHDTQLTIDMMSECVCVCVCISDPTTTTTTSKAKQEVQTKQGVHHIVALPFTLKSILRQKKKYRNSNISPCKKYNLLKKSSK